MNNHQFNLGMEGVSTFLESSTIHGLTYISTTRKFARLFWILVVISGFIVAAFLIKESFNSWSDSPIKTTIETFPISDVKLPKLTVCPPKNTFTDLNYDLMMTENLTLTENMKDEMFKYAFEVINEDSFSENNWTKLHDEDRFYNWYHGYTEIRSPYKDHCEDYGLCLHFEVNTRANSGVITTQYYREKFQPDLVDSKLDIQINVYPPKSVTENNNILHLKVEKASMTELADGSIDRVDIKYEYFLDPEQTIVYKNFTIHSSDYTTPVGVHLSRSVSSWDVELQKLDVMPGFRLSWWYTGATEVIPDSFYEDEKLTKHFVR